MLQRLFLPLLLIGLPFFSGCSSLNPDKEQIEKMAAQAYQQVKSEAKLSNNAEWKAILDRVASRVARESGENNDWEWILIDSPEANAWAMPGGKIAVYTGILPIVKNEAGLAAVLGHEVSHVTLDHGQERYARAIRGSLAGLVIGGATAIGGQAFCKSETCRMLTGLGGAAAGFAITFFERKFSREDEIEADKVGLQYMAKAGYKPSEALEVWRRMGEATKGQEPPEFLSTHPHPETRQKLIKDWLPEARDLYSEAPKQLGIGAQIQ